VGLGVASITPQVKADCATGDSRFAGSRGYSTVQWNLKDPTADYAYFMVEAPTTNEGALGDPAVFRGLAADLQDFGSPLDEALVVGESFDLGGAGLETAGCPVEGQRGVFLFSDSRGTTCVSVVGHGFYWDFDTANPNTTPSPFLSDGAYVLTRFSMDLRVSDVLLNEDLSSTLRLTWTLPLCFTDAPFTLPITGYDIFALVVPSGGGPYSQLAPTLILSVPPGETAALLTLAHTPGYETYLFVGANLDTSGRAVRSGASVRIITDPNLAIPGKSRGRGKGLATAPGQNR